MLNKDEITWLVGALRNAQCCASLTIANKEPIA
jgi:hypothetical protein